MSRHCIVLLFAGMIAVASAATPPAPADSAMRHFVRKVAVPKRIGYTLRADYQLSLPQAFKAGERRYPAILFLHGESVNGDSGLPLRAVPSLTSLAKDSAVIIAPRCAAGQKWQSKNVPEAILALLDSLKGACTLDSGRIYLAGEGDGASAAYTLIAQNPAVFSGVIAINGQGRAEDAWMHKHVPTWIVHGAAQKNLENAEMMALALEASGGIVKKTVLADSLLPAVSPQQLSWLLTNRRAARPAVDSTARTSFAIVNGPSVLCLNPFVQSGATQRLELLVANTASLPVRMTVSVDNSPAYSAATKETTLTVPAAGESKVAFSLKKLAKDPFDVNLSWSATYAIGPDKRPFIRTGKVPVVFVPLFFCGRVSHAVTLDGKVNEWKELPLTIGKTAESGNTIRFITAYDSLNWYAAIDVTDDDVVLDPAKFVWEQDGIELRFDARDNGARVACRGDGEMRDFLLFGVSPARDEKSELVVFQKERLPKDVTVRCVRTEKGFSAEIAVPITYLNEKQKQPWSGFRFNLALNDVDGTKAKVGYWFCPDWRSKENIAGSGTFLKK